MSKFNQGNTKASKLTGVEVMEIREKYASGLYTYDRLSCEYHVATNTIRSIVKGTSWQELPSVTPHHVVEEGALRSMRKLDALLSPSLPPASGDVDDETFAAMGRAAAAVQAIPEFNRPSDAMAERLAGYGVTAPKGDGKAHAAPLTTNDEGEKADVDENGSEESEAGNG